MKSSKLLVMGYAFTILTIVTLVALSFLTPGDSSKLSYSSINYLNEDWEILSGNQGNTISNLPVNEKIITGEELTVRKILPEEFASSRHILLRSSLQKLKVYLDEKEIYELKFNDNSFFKIPAASLWNIIEIPEDSYGKTLTIKTSSNFARFSGVINPVIYGSVGDLNLYIVRSYSIPFFISVFILILGLFLCLIPAFIKTEQKSALLFLGLFTVTISLWFIAETRMMQFFTGNKMILGSLAYLMLAITLAPFSIYIREVVSEKFRKIFAVFAAVFYLDFLIIIFLQLSGIIPFFNSLIITHALMAGFLITTTIVVMYEIIIFKNRQARNIFYSSVFLILFGIVELLSFYMTRNTMVGKYLLTGVLIFIAIQAATYLRQIQKQNLKSMEADMLRELAYKDYMTKGGNRLAFELDMEKVFSKEKSLNSAGLIFFDVDGMKNINDKLGHIAGDEAIVFAFNLIDEVFGKHGKSYRIGGDEFAVIVNLDEDNKIVKIKSLIDDFNEKLEESKNIYEYPVKISAGGILYNPKLDPDIKSMINRADKAMYDNKNKNSKRKI